ncbi:MAG: glycogen/starch synthase [Deltaproteobacteria bacterium]|nr:glycogen/starch synthase [Deltaproteobacteria bacterium]
MNNQDNKKKINDIWIVTREYDGLAGAGGVKDVCRQLAEALAGKADVSVVLPMYGFITPESLGFKPAQTFQVDMHYVGVERREDVQVWELKSKEAKKSLTVYLLDAQRFKEKRGVYTYTAKDEADDPTRVSGSGHYDYFAMNVLLQKATLNLILDKGKRPDIIHCHDGHAALLPAMAREIDGLRQFFRKTGMIVTIHNAGLGYHQEVDDLPFAKAITRLPSRIIGKNLLNGRFDPFLAAAPYAVMNTVSENYARELRESPDDEMTGWLGHLLTKRGVLLQGVTNGINPDDFNPQFADKQGIAAPFSPEKGDLAGKRECRRDVVRMISSHHGLEKVTVHGFLSEHYDQPLFTLIGRLSEQKGVDMLVGALEKLLPVDEKFQVLILGSGAKEIENGLIDLTTINQYKGRICILSGYDQQLANKIYAAGDFFLIPSRYEPCGLTDYIAQLFGNLPIVHHVGGLVKVEDGRTGFAYHEPSDSALLEAMRTAVKVFRLHPEKISGMQKESVKVIHNSYTWDKIVLRYIQLYQEALSLCHKE